MNRLIAIFFFSLIANTVYCQIITTVSGNGIAANNGDNGLASAASINYPCYGVFDKKGNYYFTTGVNGKTVRKIDLFDTISTIAGITGAGGFSGDSGLAVAATFDNPQGIAIDTSGNIYIADAGNNRIRKIDNSTDIITTFAGTGAPSFGGDSGLAINASIFDPNGICFDVNNNLYIAEYGSNRIRKITSSGIINTFAGTGIAGYYGDGGKADTSQIRGVFDVCSDEIGNIYIADEANGRVRVVNSFGIISTIAGTGVAGYTGDGGIALDAEVTPHDISCDRYGNLYTCDIYANKIRRITKTGIIELLAGTGTIGFYGDGNMAVNAQLNGPHKIVIDSCNNLFFSDLNNYRIRKITYPKCDYLAIDDIQSTENITIYPNPATTEISINNITTGTNYAIVNIVGIIEQSGTLKEGSNIITINAIPPGIYLLELTDEDGRRTVKKIVKE